MTSLHYQPPKHTWDLSADEIRVCLVKLAGSAECVERYKRLLTIEELERGSRFYTAALHDRFVFGRGILRAALAACLGVSPSALRFMYGKQGKPFFDNERGLLFNLSHSGDRALLAISLNRELGIDIERVRQMSDSEGIASRFFCAEECGDLLALPEELRNEAFFRCWTRKEAYIKALGGGLSVPLDSFRVTLLPDDRPMLTTTAGNCSWVLHDVSPGADYIAALASNGSPAVISAWQFTDAMECAEYFGV
jgi:4'-phosphopantetheinyl transferase